MTRFLRHPGPVDHVVLAVADGSYEPKTASDHAVTIVPFSMSAPAVRAWTAVVESLPADISTVLLYEVDRVTPEVADAVLAGLPAGPLGWSVPVVEMPETVKIVDQRQRIVGTLDRETVLRMRCPQAATRAALEAVLPTVPANFPLNALPFYAERLGISVVRGAG
ncbi:glycosyltransferase family protein [Fodinicola feengrottensis]|uniref:2-C-methyl-D-erythritol 4-phosphate cytidylyltransferase n=1 Tax=Fodinicola feengrottensis TaxID=435914 RepID=UPI0013D00B5A|nr:2-C-methyl-D-erythritol 4-phosphate cytidylyltransferase [Fodinicola feengrottensis]